MNKLFLIVFVGLFNFNLTASDCTKVRVVVPASGPLRAIEIYSGQYVTVVEGMRKIRVCEDTLDEEGCLDLTINASVRQVWCTSCVPQQSITAKLLDVREVRACKRSE